MALGQQNRYATVNRGRTIDRAEIDVGLRQHMLGVYNYMATGLAISGLVAWIIANVPAVRQVFYTTVEGQVVGLSGLGMIGIFAPLALLFIGMFTMRTARASTVQALYWAYVALQGIGLSVLLQVYTGESVVRVFFITAAAFAGLSLYGYTTKRNLSAFGSFLMMGLIGLLIAMVVNIFVASSMLQFVISAAGVLIFAGLIAYDTQAIKEMYVDGMDSEVQTKTSVMGAWMLYISFLNLFQFLLMFLGNRE
ncbi:MAG TPA: Bax inhibitor-1/YccA family protein [Alphaproteobacteria bacterium]|nr:Bax inhibitor-1/YccA family protein [Alphaproteobacteria bacterium]